MHVEPDAQGPHAASPHVAPDGKGTGQLLLPPHCAHREYAPLVVPPMPPMPPMQSARAAMAAGPAAPESSATAAVKHVDRIDAKDHRRAMFFSRSGPEGARRPVPHGREVCARRVGTLLEASRSFCPSLGPSLN